MDAVAWSEVARNRAIVLGGALGRGLAWWRGLAASRQAGASRDQAELKRRDHASELFNRAVGQLSHERLEVRLGAIYTLNRLGLDFPDMSFPVILILQAFVADRSRKVEPEEEALDLEQAVRILRDADG